MFGKKGSKILKLPPVRNLFTLAMTNKLVVFINSLKVPKIKKILLYKMKFLVPNYSCLQNPWLGFYRPQILVRSVLCPRLNLLNPPPRTKFLCTPLPSLTGGSLPRFAAEGPYRAVARCRSADHGSFMVHVTGCSITFSNSSPKILEQRVSGTLDRTRWTNSMACSFPDLNPL